MPTTIHSNNHDYDRFTIACDSCQTDETVETEHKDSPVVVCAACRNILYRPLANGD